MRRIVLFATLLTLSLAGSDALAGKGGGRPGGGGGGGGGGEDPPPTADPAIAWVHYESRSWNLKVMNADGSNQAVLVSDVPDFAQPSWSADGAEVLFSYEDPTLGGGLYSVPADGSAAPRRILSTLGSYGHNASWSPTAALDGDTWIVWEDQVPYSGRYDIWTARADGTCIQNITAHLAANHYEPVWARSGTQIVAERRGGGYDDLVLYDLDVVYDAGVGDYVLSIMGSGRSLTDGVGSVLENRRARSPAYGRASDRVLVSVLDTANGDNYDLWEIDPAHPGNPIQITSFAERIGPSKVEQELHPTYGPNDTEIVFEWRRKASGNSGIYKMDADGTGTPTQLVSGSSVWHPSWGG